MQSVLNKLIPHRDITSGLLLMGLSLWVWWQSASFPQLDDGYPGPSLFPRAIAICIGIAGAVLLMKRAFGKSTSNRTAARNLNVAGVLRLLAGLALAATYPLLIQYTHFIPIMAMVILFVGLLLKNQAWNALLMSVLSAALIYALFTQLLGVPL